MDIRYDESVAVCMSTYNGSKYLREQIDSILNQSWQNWTLLIRDDGSSDATLDIIREYCKKYNNIIFINDGETNNIGPLKSFLTVLQFAYNSTPALHTHKFAYFAFADQDDVWLDRKIERAVQMLKHSEKTEHGRLYYSNKTIVDEKLKVLYDENIKYYGDYLESLNTSLAFGCTMLFDRAFADLLCRHIPKCNCFHDNWAYRVGKTLSCDILFDDLSSILYRQHTANVAGIHEKKDLKYYLKAIKHVLLTKNDHFLQQQIAEIASVFPDEMKHSAQADIVHAILNYQNSFPDKMRLLQIDGLDKRNRADKMNWAIRVLLNHI